MFGPFQALVTYMYAHNWMFPAGWAVSALGHWLIVAPETNRQRNRLAFIRRGKGGKAK